MELLMIYSEPDKLGWNGLMTDMHFVEVHCIWRTELVRYMPTRGNHANKQVSIEPYAGVGDIMEHLRGSFEHSLFFLAF